MRSNLATFSFAPLLVSLILGCGSGLESNNVENGDTLHVNETRTIALPVDYSYARCTFDPESTCTKSINVQVTLPQGVDYAGEPETRVSTSDVLFGEIQLDEPSIVVCETGETVLSFSFPQFEVRDDSDSSSSSFFEDVLNAASETFVIKVRGGNSGKGGVVRYFQSTSDIDSSKCGSKIRGTRVLELLVK